MMCLFSASYQISFCPLGSSFWPCLMYCRFPPCEEIAAAAAAASVLPPQPGLPPSSPFTRAGQPRKAWLDFREAQILQPRQSRLHRWVTITHAIKLLLPLNFSSMRSTDIWDYVVLFLGLFLCLFVTSGVGHVCISHVKRHFLHPSVQYTHILALNCTEMPEGTGDIFRGVIIYLFVFLI